MDNSLNYEKKISFDIYKNKNALEHENLYNEKDNGTMIVDEDNSFYEMDLECLENINNLKKKR